MAVFQVAPADALWIPLPLPIALSRGALKPADVAGVLELSDRDPRVPLALRALESFLTSADAEVAEQHLEGKAADLGAYWSHLRGLCRSFLTRPAVIADRR